LAHRAAYYQNIQKQVIKENYDPVAQKNKRLVIQYRITLKDYEDMYESQKGLCLICLLPFDVLAIDHDHSCCPGNKSCGKCIRGLLCHFCNTSLGGFKDNIENLKRAIQYLEKHNV